MRGSSEAGRRCSTMFRISARRTMTVYSSQDICPDSSLFNRRTYSASGAVIERFWMICSRLAKNESGRPSRPSNAVKMALRSPSGMMTAYVRSGPTMSAQRLTCSTWSWRYQNRCARGVGSSSNMTLSHAS